MTEYERYRKMYDRLLKMFRPRVERALRAQVKFFTDAYKEHPYVTPDIIPSSIILKSLKQLHITAGLNGAKMADKSIHRQTKKADGDQESTWIWVINEYLKQNGLTNLSVEITDTLKKQIMKVLIQGNTEGWGIDKMVSYLNDASFPRWMAVRIVRTETNKAANTGAMVAAASSNVEIDKKWNSAQDNRTRRIPRNQYDHLFMNGVKVGYDERFTVPSTKTVDAMLYPGDPSASAGNLCNCRCMVSFEARRDENDQLIPITKPKDNPFSQLLRQAITIGIQSFLANQLIAENEQTTI